jgi:hypothetical protein
MPHSAYLTPTFHDSKRNITLCYGECRYGECRHAECHYADCRGAIGRVRGGGLSTP